MKTAQTIIQKDDESLPLYYMTRSLLNKMAEKYDVEPSKLLIGMQFGEMVVQVYDQGGFPVWRTLEIIQRPSIKNRA